MGNVSVQAGPHQPLLGNRGYAAAKKESSFKIDFQSTADKGEWVLPLRSTPRLLKNMFREWNVGQMCSDARISYKNPSVIVKNQDTPSFIIVSKDCFMSSLSAWTGQRRRQLLRCSATLHWTAEHTAPSTANINTLPSHWYTQSELF